MNRREALASVSGGLLALGATAVAQGAESPVAAQTTEESIKLLTDVRQATRFTDEPINEHDLQKIVTIGLNAPSALNLQPWFFTVVTDRKLLAEIDKAAHVDPKGRLSLTGSPTVILISTDVSQDYSKFDVGVATDRMNVAALMLGYGCKTVATAPKVANDKRFKDKLGVPKDYTIIAALLIGKEIERSVDGVSGATTREPLEKKFFFVR
ncbi:MAG: nitroreductase family protein [Planctomycetia bacterium]|nr:nitroreductase family protein [Planctomycetia bacterium]